MKSTMPLWLAGFRPFFLIACMAGLSLPLPWVLLFTGAVPPPPTFAVSPLQWHAHEMFYGFGWAGLGGFLLTATKNWVGVRGWYGRALALLVMAWLLDRIAMSFGDGWPPLLFWPASGVFMTAMIAMLMHTLMQQKIRESDSDNYFFWIMLPLFLPAKLLIVQGDFFVLGWSMTLALFRLAFLIMLERTQVQFMRHAFRLEILRDPKLDMPIKWLAVVLVFAELLPSPLAGLGEIALSLLLIERFIGWHPRRAFSRLDIGIMYLGYLMIVAQLFTAGVGRFIDPGWVGTVGVHLFTVGVMGLILPAMIVRISKGHTGRNVVFESADKLVLWLMVGGLLARIVLPQLFPARYTLSLYLAATCWLIGFVILLWRVLPMAVAPRLDGREH